MAPNLLSPKIWIETTNWKVLFDCIHVFFYNKKKQLMNAPFLFVLKDIHYKKALQGQRHASNIISEHTVKSVLECVRHCTLDMGCTGFNIQQTSTRKTCQHFTAAVNPVVVHDTTFSSFEIFCSNWRGEISGLLSSVVWCFYFVQRLWKTIYFNSSFEIVYSCIYLYRYVYLLCFHSKQEAAPSCS